MRNDLHEQAEKLFLQACAELKINTMLPDVSFLPSRNQKAILAFYKLSVIIQCVNEDWLPDWQDEERVAYCPWFSAVAGARACLSFSDTAFAASKTLAHFGSRFCYKRPGLAKEWGQKLLPLYEDILLLN